MSSLTFRVRQGVHQLSRVPLVFDCLRWILEGGFRAHHKMIQRNLQITDATKVLDVGCGTGQHASCFPAACYRGIDLFPFYIERARTRFPSHRFTVMDATQLAFPSQSFDAVVISGVLHHLSDEASAAVLRECVRVLKPTGTLLVWEDIPTERSFNWLGKLVQQLDVGEHIRKWQDYQSLIEPYFTIDFTESLSSGCMDYAVFRAHPQHARLSSLQEKMPAHQRPCDVAA